MNNNLKNGLINKCPPDNVAVKLAGTDLLHQKYLPVKVEKIHRICLNSNYKIHTIHDNATFKMIKFFIDNFYADFLQNCILISNTNRFYISGLFHSLFRKKR